MLSSLFTAILTVLLATGSGLTTDEVSSIHQNGMTCHKPGRLPTSTIPNDNHKNKDHYINEEIIKFVEYSCQVGSKRSHCGKSTPGMGNVLQVFPAVYLMAMITGRELIILDDGGLGRVCQVIKCGFDFTSRAIELFPSLKKTTKVRSMIATELSAAVNASAQFPERIVGYRGVNVANNNWYLLAGSYARDCVQHVTGNTIVIVLNIIIIVLSSDYNRVLL